MKLIVGLGNVGRSYANTRHNIGFMVIDEIAKRYDGTWKLDDKLKSEIATVSIDGEEIVLAKPQTMMNVSGDAIQKLMSKYGKGGLTSSRMWVIHDDIDLADGEIRTKIGGASGGQRGVQSIIERVGTEFHRIRIGIGRNNRDIEPSEEYVMKPISTEMHEEVLDNPEAFDRILDYISNGQ